MKNICSAGVVAVFLLVVAIPGCEEPAAPERAVVEISIGDAATAFDSETDSLALTIPYTIANVSGAEILFGPCPPVVQRETEDGWLNVYSGACIMERSPSRMRAGEVVSGELRIRARLQEGVAASWTSPIDGAYRVLFMLRTEAAGDLPTDVRSTPVFHLTSGG